MKKKSSKKIIIILILVSILIAVLLAVCLVIGGNDSDEEKTNVTKNKNAAQSEDEDWSEDTEQSEDEDFGIDADQRIDADSFTLMVYVCGSDLESELGAATYNLEQMALSNAGDKLKVIVETGGAKEWQNDLITSESLQRYEVIDGDLEFLEDAGNNSIVDPDQLSDFIEFCVNNYPADRYGFIFWDHGGGTIGGYGSDQLFDENSMSISDIQKGFEKAGVHFDFIGFDCCLMCTIEIANSLYNYADYMIASEETEPGTGWYYTDFMNLIADDPGVSMRSIGKQIIDDFNSTQHTAEGNETTLSLIDLTKIPNVMEKLNDYMNTSEQYLVADGYQEISIARNDAKSFGDDEFEQVDIIDYIGKLSNVDGTELQNAIDDAVVYHKTRIKGSNGIAMYYPYYYTENYNELRDLTNSVGMNNELYNQFFDDFVSLMTGGQVGGGGVNPYSSDGENYDYEQIQEESWYDEELVSQYEQHYSQMNSNELEITEKGDSYVLQLSYEDWELITDVQLQVYLDDGEGYFSLGSNDAAEFDDDGDLIVEFDYTWYYLNDCIVPYYADHSGETDEGYYYSIGYIPAYLNGETKIQIWVLWVEDSDSANILGYTVDYDGNISAKGYKEFKDGDIIDFPFEYYTYDGDYVDSYVLDDNSIEFDGNIGLTIFNYEIGNLDSQVLFYLKDIYQNEYWTEPLYYS